MEIGFFFLFPRCSKKKFTYEGGSEGEGGDVGKAAAEAAQFLVQIVLRHVTWVHAGDGFGREPRR